jgi:hypothetical protein
VTEIENSDANRARATRDIGITSTSDRTQRFYSAPKCGVNQRMSCIL